MTEPLTREQLRVGRLAHLGSDRRSLGPHPHPGGGNFAMDNLWIPEQYPTAIRATAFAFVNSVGRFIGAGVRAYGSIGLPAATTVTAHVKSPPWLPHP